MAVLKHIASKNTDYRAAFDYLVYQHNELTQKPILDENNRPILWKEYYIDGILCKSEGFARACKKTNERFRKNQKKGEIKSHHYILSFDPKNKEDNRMPAKEAQRMGMEYAIKNFPGHRVLVCTHTDGHNGSGNIHVHIVINSVRAVDAERQDFMERLCDSKVGNKHHLTKNYLKYLKMQVMKMCCERQLYQVDLLNPAADRTTEQEYFAERRGLEKLNKQNAEISTTGLTPRTTKFETRKETLRKQISEIAETRSFAEFENALFEKYSISVRDKRRRFNYKLPDNEKPISARSLSTSYDRDHLLSYLPTMQKASAEKRSNPFKRQIRRPSRIRNTAIRGFVCLLTWKTALRHSKTEHIRRRSKSPICNRWLRPMISDILAYFNNPIIHIMGLHISFCQKKLYYDIKNYA